MKTDELEEIIKEIKEKEVFLAHMKSGTELVIGRQTIREVMHVLTLSKEELDMLKKAFLSRIEFLKEKIKAEI